MNGLPPPTHNNSPSPIGEERAGARAQGFASGNGDQRRTLVVVFLRGGADGLNLVAPLDDDGYYHARPRIALSKSQALPLDGFYGLNPLLQELAPAYPDGALAI